MMFTNEVNVKCGSGKRSNAERMNKLAKAARSGDMDKFNTLYDIAYQYALDVATADKKICTSVAEDIALETMRKLYDNLDTVDYVAPWVKMVVTNAIIDYKNAKRYSMEVSATVTLDEDSDTDSGNELFEWYADDTFLTPYEALVRGFTKEAVQNVLHTLPEQQQKALLLFLGEEFSQKEVAAMMGLSRSTVAAHVRVGKKNFRKEFLAQYDIADFGYTTTSELAA